MMRTIGIFVSAAVMLACSVEPPAVSTHGEPEAQSASSNEATAEEPLGVTPAAACAVLNFCDAPGSTGTECTEVPGCSLAAAISSCKTQVAQVGCTVLCNAVMLSPSGALIETWRQSCGSKCCGEGTFCFNGNRCCPSDGPPVAGCPVQ